MSPRVFPNLMRTHEYRNLPLRKQLSFYSFVIASLLSHCFSMGTWEHMKLGEIPQNTHWNNKGSGLRPTNVHHMLLWSLSSSLLGASWTISWFELVIRSKSHYFAHLLKLCKRKENRMLLMYIWDWMTNHFLIHSHLFKSSSKPFPHPFSSFQELFKIIFSSIFIFSRVLQNHFLIHSHLFKSSSKSFPHPFSSFQELFKIISLSILIFSRVLQNHFLIHSHLFKSSSKSFSHPFSSFQEFFKISFSSILIFSRALQSHFLIHSHLFKSSSIFILASLFFLALSMFSSLLSLQILVSLCSSLYPV